MKKNEILALSGAQWTPRHAPAALQRRQADDGGGQRHRASQPVMAAPITLSLSAWSASELADRRHPVISCISRRPTKL